MPRPRDAGEIGILSGQVVHAAEPLDGVAEREESAKRERMGVEGERKMET